MMAKLREIPRPCSPARKAAFELGLERNAMYFLLAEEEKGDSRQRRWLGAKPGRYK